MRSALTVALLAAIALAACETSPTAPTVAATSPSPRTPHALYWFTGWHVASVNFFPNAINDAGVIVGYDDSSAIYYANGVRTVLPVPAGCNLPRAVDITNGGAILGECQGDILIWASPTAQPQVISAFGVSLDPVAMNESEMVVGNTSGGQVFRWSASVGLRYLLWPGGFASVHVRRLSNSGYVAGTGRAYNIDWLPRNLTSYSIRWTPTNVPTFVQTPAALRDDNYPDGRSNGAWDIDESGDLLAGAVGGEFIWRADGSIQTIPALSGPHAGGSWSTAGRIVFDGAQPQTYFDGSVTSLPTIPLPPQIASLTSEVVHMAGVNRCGTTIAQRELVGDARFDGYVPGGYIWSRFVCDVQQRLAPLAP
jgi:hypothetical protein